MPPRSTAICGLSWCLSLRFPVKFVSLLLSPHTLQLPVPDLRLRVCLWSGALSWLKPFNTTQSPSSHNSSLLHNLAQSDLDCQTPPTTALSDWVYYPRHHQCSYLLQISSTYPKLQPQIQPLQHTATRLHGKEIITPSANSYQPFLQTQWFITITGLKPSVRYQGN